MADPGEHAKVAATASHPPAGPGGGDARDGAPLPAEAAPPAARGGPRVVVVAAVAGTVALFLMEQILGLRDAGYDVAVACSPGAYDGHVRRGGVDCVPVTIPRSARLTAALAAFVRLFRLFRARRPDLIHTHTPMASLLGQAAARLAGVPRRVTTVHGLYYVNARHGASRFLLRAVEVAACRMATHVICVSAEDARYLTGRRRFPTDRVSTFHVGVNLDACSPARYGRAERDAVRDAHGIPRGAVVIGVVARLVREKGLLELFDAVAGLARRHDDVYLLLVGAPDDSRDAAVTPDAATRRGCGDRCRFVGQQDDVARFLAAMDVFCLPSHREGYPVSVMEAAAMGLPSVVSDVRGCREAVVHGETGLIVPPRDAGSLEAALEQLITSPDLRARMSEASLRRARDHFDRRIAVQRTLSLYARELARSKP